MYHDLKLMKNIKWFFDNFVLWKLRILKLNPFWLENYWDGWPYKKFNMFMLMAHGPINEHGRSWTSSLFPLIFYCHSSMWHSVIMEGGNGKQQKFSDLFCWMNIGFPLACYNYYENLLSMNVWKYWKHFWWFISSFITRSFVLK